MALVALAALWPRFRRWARLLPFGLWWNWNERKDTAVRAPGWVAVALTVVAVLAGTGTLVQAVLIGHSGATAAWSQVAAPATHPLAGGSHKG